MGGLVKVELRSSWTLCEYKRKTRAIYINEDERIKLYLLLSFLYIMDIYIYMYNIYIYFIYILIFFHKNDVEH